MTRWVARRQVVGCTVALLAAAAALVVLFGQVDVSGGGVARSCGSSFDVITDRSGWELWWAADLDDPDSAARSGLLRTRECPGAVNTRTAITAGLGVVALGGAAFATADARSRARSAPATGALRNLERLGRATTMAGVVLTLGGIVAVIVLVADADSTLFLYTDRLVVGIVGLIVLVPPMALIVIGRALSAASTMVGHDPNTADA